MIKLKPGKYWFFGFCENSYETDEPMFKEFLNKIGLQPLGYDYSCGDSVENAIGLFWFEIKDTYYSSKDIFPQWCSKGEKLYLEIICDLSWTQLSFKEKEYNNFIVTRMNDEFLTLPFKFMVKPGFTKCDENCIFYWNCDGERESPLNPVKALDLRISCKTHNFSKPSLDKKEKL